MSDRIELGACDADARWIGIRRHQAMLTIAGLGLLGDWIVRSKSSPVELVAAAIMLAGAVPVRGGLTGGELLVIAATYGTRSHWLTVAMDPRGSAWELRARGDVTIRGYELQHRGRLDLSGADLDNAQRLSEMAVGLSMRGETSHVSLHVNSTLEGASTLMTLEADALACEGWRESPQLVREVVGVEASESSIRLLERWAYLRTSAGPLRVLRVRDFSAASSGRALLEELQQSSKGASIALHLDVVEGEKAQRIAARAVHRMGSDGAASRAAGFRRTARSVRALERVGQHEELVASGEALLRIGVFVTVRADTIDELRACTKEVIRKGEQSGLRIERGVGRQSAWYCFQLPGGPGW
jgi:hypothetical protein